MKKTIQYFRMFLWALVVIPTLAFAEPVIGPGSNPPGSGKLWPVTYRSLQKGLDYAKQAYNRDFNLKGNPLSEADEDCIKGKLLEARADKLINAGQWVLRITEVAAKSLGVQSPTFESSVRQGIENNKQQKAWAQKQTDICNGKGGRGLKVYEKWAADAETRPDTINEMSAAQAKQVIEQAPEDKRPVLDRLAESLENAPPATRAAVMVMGFIIIAGTAPVWAT